MKAWFLIILQLFATLGLGVNGMLSIIMLKYPEGPELVAKILERENPPIMIVSFTAILCLFGTVTIVFYNIENLTLIEKDK